jgi:chloramphenicol-sensitive protein RarD
VAASGVQWLTLTLGRLPWIALALAGSFGSYGLLRKTAALGALEGLAVETAVIAPAALVALALLSPGGLPGLFAGLDATTVGWLLCAGPITAIPLLLFAGGARRITLATLGTLQYVSPTIQFLLGVAWFGEPLDPTRLAGFVLIWAALAIYSADGFLWMRRMRAQAAA